MEKDMSNLAIPKLNLDAEKLMNAAEEFPNNPYSQRDTMQEQKLVNIIVVDFNKREI